MTRDPPQGLAFERAISPSARTDGALTLEELCDCVETIIMIDPATTPYQMAKTERAGATMWANRNTPTSWIGHAMVMARSSHTLARELLDASKLAGTEWDATGGNAHKTSTIMVVGRPIASATLAAAALKSLPARVRRLTSVLGRVGIDASSMTRRLEELGISEQMGGRA